MYTKVWNLMKQIIHHNNGGCVKQIRVSSIIKTISSTYTRTLCKGHVCSYIWKVLHLFLKSNSSLPLNSYPPPPPPHPRPTHLHAILEYLADVDNQGEENKLKLNQVSVRTSELSGTSCIGRRISNTTWEGSALTSAGSTPENILSLHEGVKYR